MEFLILVFVLIIIFIIIGELTVYPFVKLFRFFNGLYRKHVELGIYEKRILDIVESDIIKVRVDDCPDVGITFYQPNYEFEKLPVIMFIHGGGWVGGSSKKIADFGKLLASNGYVVANIEYSLAPEYPYPTSTIQLVKALNYIYENSKKYKIDRDKIFIGGTSAGAHLSSQLGCLVADKEYQKQVGVNVSVSKISGLLLINGVYDFNNVDECHFPGMKQFVWSYLNEKKYLNHEKIDELSTINHIKKNYPAAFVTAGSKDPLLSQSLELVEKLKKNKVSHTGVFLDDAKLNHDFIYDLENADARKTYEALVEFLNIYSK